MNNKGHIPTIFMLVGTIVLIGYTLFVFASFDNNFAANSQTYSDLINDYRFKETYSEFILKALVDKAVKESDKSDFLNSFEENIKGIAERRNDGAKKLAGNFYGRLRSGDFVVSPSEDGYIITLGDVFIKSEVGGNELERTFDLAVKFDENGVIQ